MKITNTTANPLQLPDLTGGSDHIDLPPGVAVPVANWEDYDGNVIVQAWVKAGVLKAEKGRQGKARNMQADDPVMRNMDGNVIGATDEVGSAAP